MIVFVCVGGALQTLHDLRLGFVSERKKDLQSGKIK
jgi:hypothetical protein